VGGGEGRKKLQGVKSFTDISLVMYRTGYGRLARGTPRLGGHRAPGSPSETSRIVVSWAAGGTVPGDRCQSPPRRCGPGCNAGFDAPVREEGGKGEEGENEHVPCSETQHLAKTQAAPAQPGPLHPAQPKRLLTADTAPQNRKKKRKKKEKKAGSN